MTYRIGGYFMSISTVHFIMNALQIPNKKGFSDKQLEWAINPWLYDHQKLDVLSAYIVWEGEPGMILVSSFRYFPQYTLDPGPIEESSRDREIVKGWLANIGVKEEELKWITLVDNQHITLHGCQPRNIDMIAYHDFTHLPPDEAARQAKEAMERFFKEGQRIREEKAASTAPST